MKTIKAKQSTDGITYKNVRKCLCTVTEREKREQYNVEGLPELKAGEKYYELYTPITSGYGFSSVYSTLEEAKRRAEKYIYGLLFGDVEIVYL